MSTDVRPDLSEKNKYWIDRHRYYELKHFCLQYPLWKKSYANINGLSQRPYTFESSSKTNVISDPTEKCAEARLFYIIAIQKINASIRIK